MRRERKRVTHPSGGPVKTKQSEAAACDINAIMKRYASHGELPAGSGNPSYGDFSGVGDYHSAANRVLAAQADFDRLPSDVRKHVDNDPGSFLDLVYDPERRDELEELGLVEALLPDVPPVVVEPIPGSDSAATEESPPEPSA